MHRLFAEALLKKISRARLSVDGVNSAAVRSIVFSATAMVKGISRQMRYVPIEICKSLKSFIMVFVKGNYQQMDRYR